MKPMKKKELVSKLIKDGWKHERNNGKHDIWVNSEYPKHIAIPRSVEISVGMIRQISMFYDLGIS